MLFVGCPLYEKIVARGFGMFTCVFSTQELRVVVVMSIDSTNATRGSNIILAVIRKRRNLVSICGNNWTYHLILVKERARCCPVH
jgi:hypothetical protein